MNKGKRNQILGILSLCGACMFYGIISHRHHLPPYSFLQAIYTFVIQSEEFTAHGHKRSDFEQISEAYFETDVESILSIHTE